MISPVTQSTIGLRTRRRPDPSHRLVARQLPALRRAGASRRSEMDGRTIRLVRILQFEPADEETIIWHQYEAKAKDAG